MWNKKKVGTFRISMYQLLAVVCAFSLEQKGQGPQLVNIFVTKSFITCFWAAVTGNGLKLGQVGRGIVEARQRIVQLLGCQCTQQQMETGEHGANRSRLCCTHLRQCTRGTDVGDETPQSSCCILAVILAFWIDKGQGKARNVVVAVSRPSQVAGDGPKVGHDRGWIWENHWTETLEHGLGNHACTLVPE